VSDELWVSTYISRTRDQPPKPSPGPRQRRLDVFLSWPGLLAAEHDDPQRRAVFKRNLPLIPVQTPTHQMYLAAPSHFRTAPKLVRTFLVSRESVSLSSFPPAAAAALSAAVFFFLRPADRGAVALVGVAVLEPPPSLSRAKLVDNGVGAWLVGFELTDPGVCASSFTASVSWLGPLSPQAALPGISVTARQLVRSGRDAEVETGAHTAFELYEMLLREKTRFVSDRPVLRRAAAALPVVPLV